MSSRSKIPESIQKQVRQRANYLCEYCHASEQWQYVQFTVDHTMPLSLGGTDFLENLALACFHCNRRKTNRLTLKKKFYCLIRDRTFGVSILSGLRMDC
ncbi:HNH endonuclease [Nostoc sp. CHAB 5714]|uniref:HNH endonuclease n=2 Tax=Nostoc TaxID=1177 RepID=A0ABS8IL88_9NOSO|nr:HNH endonuclease [Nostoc favosum CHAB5714]